MAHSPDYKEMAAITVPTVEHYCTKHGYGFLYDPNVDVRLGDSMKINLFHTLYAGGQFSGDDVFCWIDTDALVMNSDVKLQSFLGPFLTRHVLYGSDVNGLNTGVWFARFTSHADHFLRTAQAASLSMGWADQVGIFQTALQPIFKNIVTIGPGKGFNSMLYPLYGWDFAHGKEVNEYEEGDCILHFPGIEMSARMRFLRECAAMAK